MVKSFKQFTQDVHSNLPQKQQTTDDHEDNQEVHASNPLDSDDTRKTKVFHLSPQKKNPEAINSDSMPLIFFFAHMDAQDAGDQMRNRLGSANLYSGDFDGNLADADDSDIKDLFSDNNVDLDDYVNGLGIHATQNDIYHHPGTNLLQQNGYHGIEYDRNDPHEIGGMCRTMCAFNPRQNIFGMSPYTNPVNDLS